MPFSANDEQHYRRRSRAEEPEESHHIAADKPEFPAAMVAAVELYRDEDGGEEEIGKCQTAQHHRSEGDPTVGAKNAEDDDQVSHQADGDDDAVDRERCDVYRSVVNRKRQKRY